MAAASRDPSYRIATRERLIFALDVEKCPVSGTFTGEDVRKAIGGHVLAQAEFNATYAIYPQAR